jgi:hypothetical protein
MSFGRGEETHPVPLGWRRAFAEGLVLKRGHAVTGELFVRAQTDHAARSQADTGEPDFCTGITETTEAKPRVCVGVRRIEDKPEFAPLDASAASTARPSRCHGSCA